MHRKYSRRIIPAFFFSWYFCFFFLPEEEKKYKYIPVKEEKKHIPVKNTSSRQKKNRLLAEAVMQQ